MLNEYILEADVAASRERFFHRSSGFCTETAELITVISHYTLHKENVLSSFVCVNRQSMLNRKLLLVNNAQDCTRLRMRKLLDDFLNLSSVVFVVRVLR